MKKLKLILVLCLVMTGISSCADNVLDLEDPSAPADTNFFSTEAELEIALGGIYESLAYVRGVPFPQLLDHVTDLGFSRGGVVGTGDVTQGSLSSTSDITEAYWENFYIGVQRANTLLANMSRAEEVSDPDRFNEIRAEALFLRAYFYSYLVELYGDVPLRLDIVTSLNDENLVLSRTPKAEVVAQILGDLDIAAGILPTNAAERGRTSANATNALASRIALYNGDYSLAISKAEEVQNAGVSLYPDYESLFLPENIDAEEILLSVNFAEGAKIHRLSVEQGSRFGGWARLVPLQPTLDTYETINGLPIDEDPAFDAVNPFENRDPRMKATIVTPGDVWTNHEYYQHSDSLACWRIENGQRVERVFNANSANPSGVSIVDNVLDPVSGTFREFDSGGSNQFTSFTGYIWKKFSDEPALAGERAFPATQSEQPLTLIRYAEVLLNFAEAKIESGNIDQATLNAINAVRERGYNGSGITYPEVTTMDQAELRRIVRRERKVELANEGLRLFDIRRWRTAEKVMNGAAVGGPANGFSVIGGDLGLVPVIDDDGHVTYPGAPIEPRGELGNFSYRDVEARLFQPARDYLWPIPQSEIDAAAGAGVEVQQNPGY
ncbi:RagB/SusD family nutrient uptake outer membrane protein [Flagellimonas sp. HMM57]|uniref:RagB/SusD family nutrient uptake outer membrane protein n=1 Tax=unclassified Flagellimonas TaxID=2644544 RepID=UPI0013D175D2|nr:MULTISPECIES: RagB/SusD family nutrient uptake outer membrane protein [unclassified Flagellimonas]UII75348.1 RagB/SusD family nutrient uptake outer membrane protein [Flagellimonas sp. HMM57]